MIGIVVSGSSVFMPRLVTLTFALLKESQAPGSRAAAQLVGTRWRG